MPEVPSMPCYSASAATRALSLRAVTRRRSVISIFTKKVGLASTVAAPPSQQKPDVISVDQKPLKPKPYMVVSQNWGYLSWGVPVISITMFGVHVGVPRFW